jgi:hypothetical protein
VASRILLVSAAAYPSATNGLIVELLLGTGGRDAHRRGAALVRFGAIGAKSVPNHTEPGELRPPPSRAVPRFLLGKIVGGLRSFVLIVTSDLRVGGSNPSGRALPFQRVSRSTAIAKALVDCHSDCQTIFLDQQSRLPQGGAKRPSRSARPSPCTSV